MCSGSAISVVFDSCFHQLNTIVQGPRKEERHFKAEVKALQMQPAHAVPLMEQASLPVIRGEPLFLH